MKSDKQKIVIHIDTAKEGRAASREFFKGVNVRQVSHGSKKSYTRKQKHHNNENFSRITS
jgi:hypothetical protein